MKKTIVVLIVVGLIGLFAFAGLSYASGKDDAKFLVRKAVAYVKYQGKEKAIAEISKPRGMFDKGEVYVFAYDLRCLVDAHALRVYQVWGEYEIDCPVPYVRYRSREELFHPVIGLAEFCRCGIHFYRRL